MATLQLARPYLTLKIEDEREEQQDDDVESRVKMTLVSTTDAQNLLRAKHSGIRYQQCGGGRRVIRRQRQAN